jgi:GH43 family beta-xylosidase
VALLLARGGQLASQPAANASGVFANPICEQADPWFTQYEGRYLACFSEGNRGISVHSSDRLTVLGPKRVVWTAPESGPAAREVWAPELHMLDGRWYIYFAASNGENRNHRSWVLQSAGKDPFGPYTLHGPLYTGDDPALRASNRWAIDLTVLELGARRYAIWSGWPDERDLQYLYIAPLKDPLTLAAARTRLCANDDFVWERVDGRPPGRGLNEAPEVLQHAGRTFVTYSCSGSWQASYKLGLLELKPGGDPLNPGDWQKYPRPVFQASARTLGVGHNSFVTSPDGTEDWIIYHAKFDRREGWRRVVFAQRFEWDTTGLPMFGPPVPPGQLLLLPAGEKTTAIRGPHNFRFTCEQDLEGWSYFGHHQLISVQDGWLHLGRPPAGPVNEFRSGEKLVLNGGAWSDFSATVKVRPLEQAGAAGLIFHVQAPAVGYNCQRGYFAGYLPGSGRVELGSTDGSSWREIALAAAEAPSGEVALGVSERAGQIQVSLQGKTLIQTNDGTFTSGSIGLRVVDSHAAFADLEIRAAADGAAR